ncbi:hypothetical protein BHE74_00059686, partial [Ensete ventricosum]
HYWWEDASSCKQPPTVTPSRCCLVGHCTHATTLMLAINLGAYGLASSGYGSISLMLST